MDQLGGDLMPTLARIAPHIDSLVVALTTIASDPALHKIRAAPGRYHG